VRPLFRDRLMANKKSGQAGVSWGRMPCLNKTTGRSREGTCQNVRLGDNGAMLENSVPEVKEKDGMAHTWVAGRGRFLCSTAFPNECAQ
jgi:hypothetical protein